VIQCLNYLFLSLFPFIVYATFKLVYRVYFKCFEYGECANTKCTFRSCMLWGPLCGLQAMPPLYSQRITVPLFPSAHGTFFNSSLTSHFSVHNPIIYIYISFLGELRESLCLTNKFWHSMGTSVYFDNLHSYK
jgi:hypothetical protein